MNDVLQGISQDLACVHNSIVSTIQQLEKRGQALQTTEARLEAILSFSNDFSERARSLAPISERIKWKLKKWLAAFNRFLEIACICPAEHYG